LPDLLPPNATFVLGIRVRALVDSPLFAKGFAKAGLSGTGADANANAMLAEFAKRAALTGFNPLQDLDEALIASSADQQNAPTLILLRGRFDLQKLQAGAQLYNGIAIAGSGKADSGVLAPLDSTTALAGDLSLVRAAIDRRASGVATSSALASRVLALREEFDVWAVGDRPEGFVAPAGASQDVNSIDRFQFGIRVTNGLELSAELHARSAADAKKLAATFDFLQGSFKMQGPDAPKFNMQFQNATWKISLALTEQEIQKAIAAQRASLSASAGKKTPAKPAPSSTITISGQTPASTAPSGSGTSIFTLPGKH
jgi:hypothetical protein